ncbi:MAG TPA: type II secretion system F family protein [Pyrinomonadaceae bacterium]|nr:type II secretion system F family protein [Pyrinomonadaceae bacterium]
MLLSTVIFVFFLFLTYALFLLASRKSDARGRRLEQRVAKALQETTSPDAVVQISRDDSIGGTAAINQLLSSLNFVRRLDQNIRQADMQITVIRLLMFCLLAGLAGGLAASTVLGPVSALVLTVVTAVLPILYMKRKRKKRLLKFNAQLPDTLDLLSRSLAVGHAFSESLHQVASEMPEPIAGEFRITFEEQKLGLSTKAALERMSERVPVLDLRLCLTAIQIQRETGGNLSEVLEKVSQTIRERFKLMEDFRTMTTSSRGSAWILCAFPFVILFLLTAVNPDYMSVLWHDQRGHYILGAAALMQFLGIITIRRILDIRV